MAFMVNSREKSVGLNMQAAVQTAMEVNVNSLYYFVNWLEEVFFEGPCPHGRGTDLSRSCSAG